MSLSVAAERVEARVSGAGGGVGDDWMFGGGGVEEKSGVCCLQFHGRGARATIGSTGGTPVVRKKIHRRDARATIIPAMQIFRFSRPACPCHRFRSGRWGGRRLG